MQTANSDSQINVTCPSCGLLCDDIAISVDAQGSLQKVVSTTCAKSIAFFAQKIPDTSASVAGKPASLTEALERAAAILKRAKKPIFAGLSTDLQGFRASYQLAQKTNANMMHMNAASSLRNIKVLQSTGWQTTTLTEVRNRADVILCIGTDVVQHNPRFFKRIIWVDDAMFTDPQARNIIYLGGQDLDTSHGVSPNGNKPQVLPCDVEQLPEVTAALRALVLGKTLKVEQIAGIALPDLQKIAEQLKAAKYATIIWNSKDLDFPHAELTIQNITQIATTLNESTRAAGLAVGGSDGDSTVNYAHTWLDGLTLEEHDLTQHDALVWVNSFSPKKPLPNTPLPTIVFGNANMKFESEPDVFIPVATPGLDCAGTMFRVDATVVLPLKKLRESSLPTLAEAMLQLEGLLT